MVTKLFRCEQLAEAALFEVSCLLNELGTQNVVRCVCWWLEEKVQNVCDEFGGQCRENMVKFGVLICNVPC